MRFVPTYQQILYLVLALALLIVTGGYLQSTDSRTFLAALTLAAATLGLRELLTAIMTGETGGSR